MLNLSNVTLLCVETREPNLAQWAIDRCTASIKFRRIVLITNLDLLKVKRDYIEYVQAPQIETIKDYSLLMLTGIQEHVEGSHVLIIQWDSFVTHSELWVDEFLKYDYIGPVWPHHPETPVGNGGFSLRSKKLLEAIKRPEFNIGHPEDYCICADNRKFLTLEGIKFAPIAIAEKFAVERTTWHEAFGFHGFFNFGRVLSDDELNDFLMLVPDRQLKTLDVYDLINSLIEEKRITIAKKIAERVKFKWKMRKHYLKTKWWLCRSRFQ